ncbi:protein-tyrosine phosphatase-like protein [Catenaria anguillulae PL171]|uniref:Protein-tyrosine phosphatase-like protein n=1 Tax=Catenaria anguillulae PL171 TaxID=765915 RepID=A0A1Y2H893_9FUNG|nr:protein-tyrosine phosphatase-like protein [Catenaria anguillulae PL171]
MTNAIATNNTSKTGGNIGLTSCPGKRVRLDAPLAPQMRPPVARDLDIDLPRLASMGVRLIVNCLSDDELAFLGAPWPRYSSIATSLGLTVARIPMVDGSVPPDMSILHDVIEAMHSTLQQGHNVIVHCRGGIGRAALVSCCYMLKHGIIDDAERSIEFVRQRRSRRAVETVEQEKFIEAFFDQYCRKESKPEEETQFVLEHEEQGAGAQDVDPEDMLIIEDGEGLGGGSGGMGQ